MGLRFVEGREAGTDIPKVVMYDSVTGCAFGMCFRTLAEADAFTKWAFAAMNVDDLRRKTSPEVVELQEAWIDLGKPGYDPELDNDL